MIPSLNNCANCRLSRSALKILRFHWKNKCAQMSKLFRSLLALASLFSRFKHFPQQEINDVEHLFSLFRWEMYPQRGRIFLRFSSWEFLPSPSAASGGSDARANNRSVKESLNSTIRTWTLRRADYTHVEHYQCHRSNPSFYHSFFTWTRGPSVGQFPALCRRGGLNGC